MMFTIVLIPVHLLAEVVLAQVTVERMMLSIPDVFSLHLVTLVYLWAFEHLPLLCHYSKTKMDMGKPTVKAQILI